MTEQGAPRQRKEASIVAPPYAAIDKLLTDRFGWPWKPEIQTLYAGICDLFDKPIAAASLPESHDSYKLNEGFEVTIHCHTQEALTAITSPEALRFMIGHMIDSWKLQEEVDYTLEVRRTYEQM